MNNNDRSATLNTGSASIGNGLRNPYSKSRIHLDHSPWATPLYWFLELCFPPAKIPMPSFAACFRYVFLTNQTDFHSSSNLSLTPTLFKHQTVTIYKNSDYGQEAPRLKSYLKSWKNKRPDTLATRNSSPGNGDGMFLRGKCEKLWSKTSEQVEVARSAFWRGEVVSGWISVYSA